MVKRIARKLNGRKFLAGMLTSFGIAMSFNAVANDMTTPVEPAAATISAPETLPVREMTAEEKQALEQERLTRVFARMKQTPIGRELLAFANKHDIDISFKNPRAAFEKNKDVKVEFDKFMLIAGVSYSNIINLDPRFRSDDELLLTMVHEIRHVWQDKAAKVHEGLALESRQEWLLDRYKEADSFAFQIHFAYEYKKETGEDITFRGTRSCHVFMSQGCLMEIYSEKRDAGMTAEEAYPYLVEAAFKHAKQLDYDTDFLDYKKDRWNEVLADPEKGVLYEQATDRPSSDAELIAALRRMVSTTLIPGGTPGLSTWQDADIISFEKTGGVEEKHIKQLEEVRKLQNSAMQVYKLKKKPPTGPNGYS